MAMNRELNVFFVALAFFTRLPVPKSITFTDELLNHSTRYYGIVGLCIASLLAGFTWIYSSLLPIEITVILVLATSVLITGAFHEDGFTDMCDGFGGGFTPEKKLEIMKDSRVGTYGTIAMVCVFGIMYQSLLYLLGGGLLLTTIALLTGHSLSRIVAGTLIANMEYLRALDTRAKAKPLSTGMRKSDFIILILSSLFTIPLLAWECSLVIIVMLVVIHFGFKRYLNFHLGGYTGDCLGASQVFTMIMIWIIMCIFKFHGLDIIAPWILSM